MGRSVLGSWIEADKEQREFVELVRKMREAQRYRDMCCDDCTDACVYEYHVDEYLKKKEDEE